MHTIQNGLFGATVCLAEVAIDSGALSEKLTIGAAAGLMLWWILNTQTKKMESMEAAIKELAAAVKEVVKH
jgi:hypothetical protein